MNILSGKITIREIFQDHWEPFLSNCPDKLPDYIIDNVEKMLRCRDPQQNGFFKYACPYHPDQTKIKPLSCKSRFCNVCGILQSNIWMHKALDILPNARFYHITFSVPDYLWYFFKLNPTLIKYLFKASAQTILSWFKERGIIPAICSGLHTFGKDLKYYTHIHMILSAGGLCLNKKDKYIWKPILFIPYKMLRDRFKGKLMAYLKPYLDKDLKELLYKLNWYTYMRNDVLDVKSTAQYIGRYAKKPPLAETRITDYDGQFVTFFFKERDKSSPTYSRLSAHQFIEKLIQHILPTQFRAVRYYGLLANRISGKFKKIISKLFKYVKNIELFPKWRERQSQFLGRDPLSCPICNETMVLVEFAFFSKSYNCLVHHYY